MLARAGSASHSVIRLGPGSSITHHLRQSIVGPIESVPAATCANIAKAINLTGNLNRAVKLDDHFDRQIGRHFPIECRVNL